jgi:hypothetical protein
LARKALGDAVIAIEHKAHTHKVLRVIAMGDGGFAIAAPYFPPGEGRIAKVGAPKILAAPGHGWVTPLDEHRVAGRVKLSYHPSGFVQFSETGGSRVQSGRSGPEGHFVPKGMAINSNPFTDPILSGPSVLGFFLNIHDAAVLDGSEKVRVITFQERELHDHFTWTASGLPNMPTGEKTYVQHRVDVFVFPIEYRRDAVYTHSRGWVLTRPYGARDDLDTEFRVIDLRGSVAFLGVTVVRLIAEWTKDGEPTGYSMTGPRDLGSGYWLSGTWARDTPDDPGLPRLDLPERT